MAEPWIKMRTDLATNPKVVAIAELLKLTEDEVVGKMHRLWSWADKHAKDGRAMGSPAWLDRMMKCKGLAAALMREEIDWLEFEDGVLVFPRWEEHNSQSAKTRATAMRRMQKLRAEENAGRTSVAPDANTSATESERPSNASATRGDKRRGEKNSPPPTPPPQPVATDTPDSGGGGGLGDDIGRDQDAPTGRTTVATGAGAPDGATKPVGSSRREAVPHSPVTSGDDTQRSQRAQAMLDTLIGSGVWPSVAETAIDQAGVELVGAVVAEWGKLPKPTPELLGSRLRELVKPGSDIRKCAESYIAKVAERKARAEQRNLTLVRPDRSGGREVPRFQGDKGAGSSPRHLTTSTPVAAVPGITDHPAFRNLTTEDAEARGGIHA